MWETIWNYFNGFSVCSDQINLLKDSRNNGIDMTIISRTDRVLLHKILNQRITIKKKEKKR